MAERILPKYPVYIPSKGRVDGARITARILERDRVPFQLVIEDHQEGIYREAFPNAELLILPFRDQGSVVPARNWIKDHATEAGFKRHWQLDDNILGFYYRYQGQRIPCRAGIALRACEDLTDQYSNVAISGHQYAMFVPEGAPVKPFVTNCHVYSCSLINNEIPHRWRGIYNEDTDICLQALSDDWCTLLLNAFLADKQVTMARAGGNKTELYDDPDGRLKMARSLEQRWPGVVTTKRRFGRAQHVIFDSWKRFDTPLVKAENPPPAANYQLELKALQEVKSEKLRKMVAEANEL